MLNYPLVADTVIDMSANILPDGWSYKLLGNVTKFDQPPVWYVYDASSIATPDGVNVIIPTMITAPAPGRYVKRPDSYTALTNTPTLATVATSGNYSDLIGRPSLATVATTGSYTDLTNIPTKVFSVPSRTLNSAPFQISSTRDSFAAYSIQIAATISLTAGQTGTVSLQMASTSGGTYVTVGTITNGNTGSLTVGLNLTQTQSALLSCMVPAGFFVKLVSTGTATNTIVAQQEVLL